MKSLFIFRRDLRLEDNTALMSALQSSASVIPCFIFDPRQIDDHPFKSIPAVQFMAASLLDLEEQLKTLNAKLYIFQGLPHEVVRSLIESEQINAVYVNGDYTPFSQTRDQALEQVCALKGVPFHAHHDLVLNPPGTVKKDDGGVYTIYTPYCRKAMTKEVARPTYNGLKNYYTKPIALENRSTYDALIKSKGQCFDFGGRKAALTILKSMSDFKNYDEERNVPSLNGTTRLSAYHKFGTCSIRETYHTVRDVFGVGHTLIRELYWRDFFVQIGFHFPHVLEGAFHRQYNQIKWVDNSKIFKMWCEGKTGFPIVDAGMRELNASGFMHNRVRMVTASFLVKDLHIDWRQGEQYFASKLVDYDPLVNNGNWQWAASTGCDAQPYFRIFNPWLQQEKFDPLAEYIKQWVPELQSALPKDIHQIAKKGLVFSGYPSPIVWHEGEKAKALAIYNAIKKGA